MLYGGFVNEDCANNCVGRGQCSNSSCQTCQSNDPGCFCLYTCQNSLGTVASFDGQHPAVLKFDCSAGLPFPDLNRRCSQIFGSGFSANPFSNAPPSPSTTTFTTPSSPSTTTFTTPSTERSYPSFTPSSFTPFVTPAITPTVTPSVSDSATIIWISVVGAVLLIVFVMVVYPNQPVFLDHFRQR